MGSCSFPMDRRVGGFASSAAGSVPQLSGDARVVASDRVAAQSVCGGADLGRMSAWDPDHSALVGIGSNSGGLESA